MWFCVQGGAAPKGVAAPQNKDKDGNDIVVVSNEAVLIFLPGMKEITTLQVCRGMSVHCTLLWDVSTLCAVAPPAGLYGVVGTGVLWDVSTLCAVVLHLLLECMGGWAFFLVSLSLSLSLSLCSAKMAV